jgi:hypothetical protein
LGQGREEQRVPFQRQGPQEQASALQGQRRQPNVAVHGLTAAAVAVAGIAPCVITVLLLLLFLLLAL